MVLIPTLTQNIEGLRSCGDSPASLAPVRVLVLSNYFPQPENHRLGTWGLLQAQALNRGDDDVRVISPVIGIPRAVRRLPGDGRFIAAARRWASCPPRHNWDGLDVLYPRWPLPHFGPHNGWFYRHPGYEARLAWQSLGKRLLQEVGRFRPDVIYAHGTALCGYLALKVKANQEVPFVTVDHSFEEIADCDRFPNRRDHLREVAAESSASLADCRRIADDIGRLLLTPRAVALNTAADLPPDDLPDRSSAGEEIVVFSAASFTARKGIPTLVRAFARATRETPNAVLRIAGDGPMRAEVESVIQDAGVSSRVKLLGYLPHRELLAQMSNCDVFALIGWDEPCATVYMEALAAGKPIVCCEDGGITDVLEHERQGLTVTPRDVDAAATALARLIGSEDLRRRLGEEGRKLHRKELTWDANAKRLHEVLAQAVAR
jgi:glycosyltransferase involved in cell wall biosynthesis